MPGSESILAVTASWLICVWILFVWYQKMKVSYMVIFGDEGTFEPTTEMLSREARLICWHGMPYEFTLLDIFWSNVREHICIQPFGILLMERHKEIEHVLRPVYFCDCTQQRVVITFQLFGITNRSHLQSSRCPRRKCPDRKQPAPTGCLLEELIVTEYIWW